MEAVDASATLTDAPTGLSLVADKGMRLEGQADGCDGAFYGCPLRGYSKLITLSGTEPASDRVDLFHNPVLGHRQAAP